MMRIESDDVMIPLRPNIPLQKTVRVISLALVIALGVTIPASAGDNSNMPTSTSGTITLLTQDRVTLGRAVELCTVSNWDMARSCPAGKEPDAVMGACWSEWYEPCLKIFQQWIAKGYEEQAKKARERQMKNDLDFVRGVAGSQTQP